MSKANYILLTRPNFGGTKILAGGSFSNLALLDNKN